MSTAEQPETPALTRKQLRDIRNTGATPIVSAQAPPEAEPPTHDAVDTAPEHHDEPTEAAPAPEPAPQPVLAPLPRAAVPAVVHDLPVADASVDLGVSPLTRRQARQQELIRTASVPVITPEVAVAHAAASVVHDDPSPSDEQDAVLEATIVDDESSTSESEAPAADAVHEQDAVHDGRPRDDLDTQRAVVNPQFGAGFLAGDADPVELPPSFDQLISRSVTGAIGTGNALILSQTPSAPPLVAPVTATGEILITGSFNLPEGLGSTGHAAGTADGKEVDAVLIDGELPAHSSPTPIAASAAISTVKNGGDIIKPPAPEKGGRLMLTLAITAGVLALALVGVLILAFVTGVF